MNAAAIQRAAALRRLELAREQLYAADPWRFCADRVNLLDPLTPTDPVRPYPTGKPYLRHLIGEWERHRKTIVWKPRRTRVSWTALAYINSKAYHLPHQRIFLIGKKQGEDRTQGSRELLWRAGWMMQHLRGEGGGLSDKMIGEMLLSYPNGSTVAAVSSEPNALRQVSGTIVVGDEFAFWEYPELSLKAFMPTLEDRGQFLGISSSAPGYFERTIYDVTEGEEPDLTEHGIPRTARDVTTFGDGLDGISEETGRPYMVAWTNPGNGFRIISLEVEADPARRAPADLAAYRQALSVSEAEWQEEYRKQFYRRGGKPVFGREYNPQLMVRDHLPLVRSEPLLIGLDFGYARPAACVAQIVEGAQFRVYRTLIGEQTTTRAFVKRLLYQLDQWFPDWHGAVQWCCDISGNRTRGEDETAEDVLRRDFKIKPKSKYSLIAPSLDLVRDYMNSMHRGEPGFLVHRHPDTVFLRRGLEREYRYPKATDTNPHPDEPEKKNPWRDVMDAMRYIPLNFGGHRRRHDPTVLRRVAAWDAPPVRRYAQ